MRILITLHNFLPAPLMGAESVAIAQMREMKRRGHELGLFYAGNAPADPRQLESLGLGGITLFPVRFHDSKAQVLLSIHKPHVARRFSAVLRDFRPDLVLFHHLVRLSLDLPVLAARAGIPAAYVLHDYYWVCPSYSLFTADANICPGGSPRRCAACLYAARHGRPAPWWLVRLAAPLIWWRDRIVRRTLPTIPLFITPSAALVAELAVRGAALTATAVIRNGQDAVAPGESAREPSGPVRFGYIGGLYPKKGLAVLTQAFAGHLGRQLVIRGFQSDEAIAAFRAAHPTLEARLERFDADRASFYRQVDVVVVPSIWLENQPMVIIESFAHRKPVIASRVGGLPEMLIDGAGGRLFPAGDVSALRRVATELAADPGAVARLAEGIPAWPGWPETTDALLRLLAGLVARSTSAREAGRSIT